MSQACCLSTIVGIITEGNVKPCDMGFDNMAIELPKKVARNA